MENTFTFTAEELIVMLSVAGFDEEAKSLVENASISTGTKELEVMFNSTIAQLKIKGIWDKEKEKQEINPIADEVISFLEIYANTRFLIRATHEEQRALLIFHYIDFDKWLYHYVEENSIHRFTFISEKDIPNHIKNFYNFQTNWTTNSNLSFSLTDRQFDSLKKPKNVKKIKNELKGPDLEAFSLFQQDLTAQGFEMDNISVFYINEKKQLLLENIGFIFFSDQGIWLTQYEPESGNPVRIKLASEQEWDEYLENVYFFTASLINERVILNK